MAPILVCFAAKAFLGVWCDIIFCHVYFKKIFYKILQNILGSIENVFNLINILQQNEQDKMLKIFSVKYFTVKEMELSCVWFDEN